MVVVTRGGLGLDAKASLTLWKLGLFDSWLESDVDGGVAKGLEIPLDVECVICMESGIPFLTHGRTV